MQHLDLYRPQALDGGLILRRGRPEDADGLGTLYAECFQYRRDTGDPNERMRALALHLARDGHPTMK